MQTTNDRFLTTHSGSLPRNDLLVKLQVALSRGERVDDRELQDAVVSSTETVVKNQIEVGIDIGNNGEQPRESFFTYVQHRMTGFGGSSSRPPFQDILRYPSWMELKLPGYLSGVDLTAAPQAVDEVIYANEKPLHLELEQFGSLLDNEGNPFTETFMTSPSPGIVATAMEDTFYGDMQSYVDALATALKTEYDAIYRAGHVLQLDCPDLAMERHTYFGERSEREFIEFIDMVIDAIGRALSDVPKEFVRMHVCWGNYNGPHDVDVPLKCILPSLIKANVGALMLSMANPRHAHEYRLLTSQNIPDEMLIIAGVIDTTTNYVEHPEVVADRIEAIVATVGDPRRVIAGTDCGFDTAAGLRDVAEEVVWAKLRALVEGAEIASTRLF